MQEYRMPVREQNSNKGTFGKVLNFAGSKNYIGAAYLSTVAILKVGAGFAALATEKDIIRSVSTLLPEAVYLSQKEGLEQINNFPVVLIGCGMGNNVRLFKKIMKRLDCHGSNEPRNDGKLDVSHQTNLFTPRNDTKPVVTLLTKYIYPRNDTKPVVSLLTKYIYPRNDIKPVAPKLNYTFTPVIDADGLNILAKSKIKLPPDTIITPHPLEAARLLGITLQEVLNDLEGSAKKLTEKYNCVTVLKTHRTIICDKENYFVNQHGNSALAKAGSGDVLAGIIAGLSAQGMRAYEAAKLGVYLHSRAGEIASEELTEYSVLASDLPRYLSQAIKELL